MTRGQFKDRDSFQKDDQIDGLNAPQMGAYEFGESSIVDGVVDGDVDLVWMAL